MGLAIYNTRAKRVTAELFIEAARSLAQKITPSELDAGFTYPPQSKILETAKQVAIRVTDAIHASHLASV